MLTNRQFKLITKYLQSLTDREEELSETEKLIVQMIVEYEAFIEKKLDILDFLHDLVRTEKINQDDVAKELALEVQRLTGELATITGELAMQTAMTKGALNTVTHLAEEKCLCWSHLNKSGETITINSQCIIHRGW